VAPCAQVQWDGVYPWSITMRKFFARPKKSQSLQEKLKRLIKLECEQLEHRAAPTETISSVLALAYTMHNGSSGLGGTPSHSASITQPQELAVTGKPLMPLPQGLPTKPTGGGGGGDSAPAVQQQIVSARPVGGLEQDQGRFGVLNDQPFNLFGDSPPPPPRTAGLDSYRAGHGGSDGNGATGAAPGSHSSTGGLEQGSYDNFDIPPHGSGPATPPASNFSNSGSTGSDSGHAGSTGTAGVSAAAVTHSPTAPSGPGIKPLTIVEGNLWVLDMNKGVVVTPGVTEQEFSTWSMSLEAQVSGATASSYSWSMTNAPDTTSVSGASTYHLTFNWSSFTGAARSDSITLTETNSDSTHNVITLTFNVTSTSSPAYSSAVTSASTWPSVDPPDALTVNQQMVGNGTSDPGRCMGCPSDVGVPGYTEPYTLGSADGEFRTTYDMPAYNPGVTRLSLIYNSTAANAEPIFITHYPTSSSTALPSTISAQLTFNGTAGSTFYYSTSSLNPGDIMEIASQVNASSLSTGRYSYSIAVTANYATPVTTTYSGSVNVINDASSPFGAGWTLSGLEHIWSVTGGVILELPGGLSLWFASAGSGTFTTPAGDFSTLTQNTGTNVYTRTLTNGTKITFNPSGYQTAVTDTDGNATSYAYNGSNEVSTITDFNSLVTSFSYTTGRVTIEDPANRVSTITLSSGQVTGITDPAGEQWTYGYDGSNDLTTLENPRSYTTTIAYNYADRVTTVTRADASTDQLSALQMQGLVPSGSGTSGSPATPVLVAQAQATYTDPRSNAWPDRLDWLGFGTATQQIDPLGDTAVTYRDANGLPWLTSDPLANRTRYNFDSNGNVTKITNPDDSTKQYTYNSLAEVTKYTDETSDVTTYTYNTNGDLTEVTNALNQVTTYTNNSQGFRTSQTDALNHTTTFGYDSRDRETTTTDALNNVTTMTYDSASDMLTTTNARGYTTSYSYDAMGRTLTEQLPGATTATYTYTYDAAGNQTVVQDPLGNLTTTTYDKLNRAIGVTGALNHTTTFVYDGNGNQVSVTNPLNQTTTTTFDAANRQTQITDANNHTTTYTLDADGNQLEVTNALNQVTSYTYNSRNWKTSVIYANNSETTYAYDASGFETSSTTFLYSHAPHFLTGEATDYTSDALHRVVGSTDPDSNTTTYTYDAAGNTIAVTDALNHTTTTTYDADNRVQTTKDALGDVTTYSYDAASNQISVTDPLGHVTTSVYDAQNRLISVTDPRGAVTTYAYDLDSRQTAITDPDANTTTYSYDAAGRLTQTTTPVGTTTYAYNSANEKIGMTDADGRVTSWTYDNAGNMLTEKWVNGGSVLNTITYTYNQANELTNEQDAYSEYSYTYDGAGNLLTSNNSGTPGMPNVVLTYTYDVFNNVTEVQDNGGGAIAYSYNGDNLLTEASMTVSATQGPLITLAYDAANRETGATRDTGGSATITSTQGYDSANRLTTITYNSSSAGALATYTYSYNSASEITQYKGPEGTLTYTYDNSGELTGVGDAESYSYSYDLNGNRNSSGYTTGPDNELTADGTNTYAYDAVGNMTSETNVSSGQVTQYTWDYRNRLTNVLVKTSAGVTVTNETFTYDVENRRIGDDLNGTQSWTAYDQDNPYADFNSSGTLTERYLYGRAIDTLFARYTGTTANWYLTDNVGSVRQLVTTSGTVQDQITYDPFGNVLSESNPSNGDRFKYTSEPWDSAIGLQYNLNRYYTPTDGRWISQDPLRFEAGEANLYGYVANDPGANKDPLGLWRVNIHVCVGFVLGGCTEWSFGTGGLGVGAGVGLVGSAPIPVSGGVTWAPGGPQPRGSGWWVNATALWSATYTAITTPWGFPVPWGPPPPGPPPPPPPPHGPLALGLDFPWVPQS